MFRRARKLGTILLPPARIYIVASVIVLLTFLSVTVWTWRNAVNNVENDFQSTLDNGTRSAGELVQSTVSTYGEVLRASSGLFSINPNLTAEDWHLYVSNLHFQQRYPGMQGISYVQTVPAEQLGDFLATNLRSDGQPYVIQPDNPRNIYNITRFIEPNTPQQQPLLGYDPSTEPIRATAMNLARDSGALAVSGRVTRLTDQQPGFVLYVPVYRQGAQLATIGQRRAALQGYITAGVRIQNLIEGLFGKLLGKNAAIQLYAGKSAEAGKLVYQSKTYPELNQRNDVTRSSHTISISGNDWLLTAVATPSLTNTSQRELPRTILLGGIILSLVASALIFTIMFTRARSITSEKNREVQEVKDNLIALASHQLRTPATGVKQFLGMVLEGYAGNITAGQREMLDKAYSSNERQLKIINQILHVSRADSGRLVLNYQRINLTKLIKDVKQEQAQVLKDRKQRLIMKLPKTDVFIEGDEQYIAMAIDNLLSNASKYSHPHTTITLTVQRTRSEVLIMVEDHGVGIEEKDLHLLFQKFSRIHNELSIAAGGNGIGLYLCQEIVELHGGTIEANSEPGVGSTFIITLPRKQ
jgi:signal transduction histidine kinase